MRISSEDLAPVLRWVRHRTGLDIEGCHQDRIVKGLRDVWQETGASEPADFLALLRHNRRVFESVAARLTVPESYFFREPAHFALLRDRIVPERLADGGSLRIWSAGCAGGEEPYSVAITLGEGGVLDRTTIVATDLSERALDRARAAVYGSWSLRRCDEAGRRRWFHRHGAQWRVDDPYRRAVTWRSTGLLDGAPSRHLDVILCRNVLLYLTAEAIDEVAATMHAALAPAGWLLVGASDPPLAHAGLELFVGPHGVAYRRVDASGPRPPAPAGSSTEAVRRPVRTTVERRVRTRRSSLRAAADRRRPSQASGSRALPEPVSRLHAAVEHMDAGRYEEALREAAAACYLDPTLVAAHLLLAHAADVVGDTSRSVQSYRQARALLLALPASAVVEPVGEPVSQVLEAVHGQLDRIEYPR